MNSDEIRNLIYLVIDGEASDTEKTTFFSNLSFDTELQNEFQDALSINRTVEFERKISNPPLALTSALFASAGLSTEYLRNSAAVTKSSVVKSPMKRILSNHFLQNSLFFAAGVFATIIIVRSLFDYNLNTNSGIISERFQHNAQQSLSSNNGNDKNVNINKSGAELPVIHRKSSAPEQIISVESRQFADSNPVVNNEKVTLSILPESDSKQISSLLNTDNKELNIDNSSAINQNNLLNPGDNSNILSGVQLEASGLGAVAYQPSRVSISSFPNKFDNFSASASLGIDKRNRIGIQGGIETYPIYIKVSDTSLSPINSLAFFGAYYQYNFDSYELYGTLEPNIRLLLGGTKTGFLTKLSLGFNWFPESVLGISLGISNTGIVSSYMSKLNYTNKIGFYYGIIYRF